MPNDSRRKVDEPKASDEAGPHGRARLLRMNEKFCQRLERAIERGAEHMPAHLSGEQIQLLRQLATPLVAPAQIDARAPPTDPAAGRKQRRRMSSVTLPQPSAGAALFGRAVLTSVLRSN